jgi:hypothetical protein
MRGLPERFGIERIRHYPENRKKENKKSPTLYYTEKILLNYNLFHLVPYLGHDIVAYQTDVLGSGFPPERRCTRTSFSSMRFMT